jgi:diaminopimelate epimerase
MTYDFSKYQGTGNDFVMIDNRDETFPRHDQAWVARLCDRRFGIGADGLILLQNHPDFDFRMVYFNADGAEGSMCGNGGRCIVRFAHDLGIFTTHTRFMAVDGEHEATVADGLISLRMSSVQQIDTTPEYSFTNTGSPHVVMVVDDLANHDVVGIGRQIRYSETFAPTGTNVNFVQTEPDGTLFVRTYERGVEGETYSCGTGVTAAALVAHRQSGMPSPIPIQTLGGKLSVAFCLTEQAGYEMIDLIGPAEKVFDGTVA